MTDAPFCDLCGAPVGVNETICSACLIECEACDDCGRVCDQPLIWTTADGKQLCGRCVARRDNNGDEFSGVLS